MINNRQGGRRRGRGGQRPQGMSGNPGNSARDNRQRGNAAQLLEKYKSMARDAQLAGDRVQTEYYLQFADHYFRVLEDSRSRFEEQQARRPRREDEEDGDEDEVMTDADGESDEDDAPPPPRQRRERTRQNERPRREAANNGDEDEGDAERMPLGVLPPAIAATDSDDEGEAKPRRRTRRPRADDDDMAPAA